MKSDLERAKKLLEYLDRFAQTPITSATISSDGVCYSENNLSIIAKALSEVRAEERERCAKVAENQFTPVNSSASRLISEAIAKAIRNQTSEGRLE